MVNADALGKLARALEQQALNGHCAQVAQGMGALQSALDAFLMLNSETTKDMPP